MFRSPVFRSFSFSFVVKNCNLWLVKSSVDQLNKDQGVVLHKHATSPLGELANHFVHRFWFESCTRWWWRWFDGGFGLSNKGN